jgi:NAD(P)-dependent dehydrogenase (short-subunit alcohol dehydrogenase family)
MMNSGQATLIVGANSEIAQSICHLKQKEQAPVILVSRHQLHIDDDSKCAYTCDYSSDDIQRVVNKINQHGQPIGQVIVCNGLLHNDRFMPEKSLSQINEMQLTESFSANVVIPMLWLQQLPKLNLLSSAKICVFSARVASIEDNRLGGWFSYRGTKAALNMMVKTAAIELKRKHKQWQFLLFHPGTTDTPLSKPFQANVPDDKLFSPDFVASRLMSIMAELTYDQVVHYIDWQGKYIDW